MNTTMTASRTSAAGTERVRQRARAARERLAIRIGLALVAWGRRSDARLTHEAVATARRNAAVANDLRDGIYADVTSLTRATI